MALSSIQAINHMTKNPVTVKPSTSLFDAIDIMLTAKVSGATVLNDQREVVGVISEIDCLQAILKGTYHGEIGGMVKEFMTEEVDSVGPEMDILAVAEKLINDKRRRMPVVQNGKFIGQYSIRSILNAVKEFNLR
ncbi:CBS domain-containing protein [Agarivorans sp. MS3-6]|uniref:CBS domain-containing protein n=1 Tax=Agarivorans sp. TSD2052 TaxID=2937286 RepID=UPI00200E7A54|nr:CBS domain-containing protein [Agarivorans sp. TSD2052]UPW17550.1 CBS domain-containing protein [Agarivorans sp. TSD2052]